MVYRERAWAKVNIGLKITGKRKDGYHTLSSYFLLVPFCDEITLSVNEGEETVIEGNSGYLEGPEDLMAKAARLYREKTGLSFGMHVNIRKNIPVKAGLGGGSSDAAAVLKILNGHFRAMTETELLSLSLSVGADVPFFISGFDFAYVGGIGERIEKKSFPSQYRYITLFRAPGSGNSTKEAYSRLDSLPLDLSPLPDIVFPLSRSVFVNDFEKIEGTGIYESLNKRIGKNDYLSLSGSGSVWFLLSEKRWSGKENEKIGEAELFVD